MTFILKTYIWALLILSMGCSSLHSKLLRLSPGATKTQVLRKFGDPHEKYRSAGKDHWIYESLKKAKQKRQGKILYKHKLSFEEGVLVNTSYERSFTSQEIKSFQSE